MYNEAQIINAYVPRRPDVRRGRVVSYDDTSAKRELRQNVETFLFRPNGRVGWLAPVPPLNRCYLTRGGRAMLLDASSTLCPNAS